MSSLLIVESPTKAKTLSKFLGNEYLVRSSFGHVRDLPKSTLGVDVENDFKPKYMVPTKAKKVISELKELTKSADDVILATDEDREGEAIAWHLAETLKLPEDSKRIVFHEITKSAIQEALNNPRGLDMNLIDAQQARRVLDRLVGYELSPFLWQKIRYGLSAGRVQSVALRLVVEREREIKNFKSEEYWSVEADLAKKSVEDPEPKGGNEKKIRARLIKVGEKLLDKLDIKNETEAKSIEKELTGAEYKIIGITKKETNRHPAPPFTTSTLQQEASRKFGMSAKQTMMLAQKLYETGYITYMRTDSVNLAQSAVQQAVAVVDEVFGKEYSNPRQYTTKSKGAQEAHEAIRPTDLSRKPEAVKNELEPGQFKLYDLIWKRTLACQMAPAVLDQTAVDIQAHSTSSRQASKFTFRANGQTIKFDGFFRAYTEGRDEEESEDDEKHLPQLSEGEILKLLELLTLQHFTEPPARYSDATLIKALEAHGIGRPSTYAPTLATIQDRGYVERVDKRFIPLEIGFLVNDMLVENFPEIVDIGFTAKIEEELDDIAEGKIKWVPVIREFYTPFKKHLVEKFKSVDKLIEVSDVDCPHCGKKMIIKFGRTGKFLACPDPESKITQPMPEEAAKIAELELKTKDEKCPLCGKDMIVRRGRFGYFLGCVDYPKCKGITKILDKTGFKCPECKIGDLVQKKARGRFFFACSRYPSCTFITNTKPTSEAELEELHKKWKAKPRTDLAEAKSSTGENPPKVRKVYQRKDKTA
ncbi:MAG: type I DNA topoisomerase [Patescibacteria group bacterium]